MKKKKKISKKKKIIIIALVIILLIILLVFASIKKQNKEVDSLEDVSSLQQIIEYMDCTYLKQQNSEEEGYYLDIYMQFKYSPYENGQSKRDFYNLVIRTLANYLNYQDFRIIDESKEILIKVNCENNAIYEIFINDLDISDYFNKIMSQNNLDKESNLKEINLTLNQELTTLQSNNWNLDNISFGNKTSTFQGYDIYFNSGYRIKKVNHDLFNIVFTKKYQNPVVNDIKVGDSLDSIKQKLGSNYEEDEQIIEYMSKDMYICFSETEISIYPRKTYDYTDFENLVKKYNEDRDFVNFMLELTDIWPDYAKYEYNSSYSDIWYPLKGIRISNSSDNMDGIQIYQEYGGELKAKDLELYQVYYKTNQSLILQYEKSRLMIRLDGFAPSYGQSQIVKEVCDLDSQNARHNIAFISYDENVPDSELSKDIVADTTFWYDNYNYIYSIYGQGIYVYNVKDLTTKAIVEGNNKNYKITNFDFETKILTYDNISIKIEI